MKNNFLIKTPFWGAWSKYGWRKNDYGVGLEKNRVDYFAKRKKEVFVRIGRDRTSYHIEAEKARQYPLERIKDYDTFVYVVPMSALKGQRRLTEDEIMKIVLN